MDEAGESDADVDGMGAIAPTSVHEASKRSSCASERAYFGPSSTSGFMKHIQAVLQPTNPSKAPQATRNEPLREQGKPSATTRRILLTGQLDSSFEKSKCGVVQSSQLRDPPERVGGHAARQLLELCPPHLPISIQVRL